MSLPGYVLSKLHTRSDWPGERLTIMSEDACLLSDGEIKKIYHRLKIITRIMSINIVRSLMVIVVDGVGGILLLLHALWHVPVNVHRIIATVSSLISLDIRR